MESPQQRSRRYRVEAETDMNEALRNGINPRQEYERTVKFLWLLDAIRHRMLSDSPESAAAPIEGSARSAEADSPINIPAEIMPPIDPGFERI